MTTTSSKSLGEARLWETPGKHTVRHPVIDGNPPPDSHIGDVRSVVETEHNITTFQKALNALQLNHIAPPPVKECNSGE